MIKDKNSLQYDLLDESFYHIHKIKSKLICITINYQLLENSCHRIWLYRKKTCAKFALNSTYANSHLYKTKDSKSVSK